MSDLLDRRLMLPDGTTFRVVSVADGMAMAAKRGQRAQPMQVSTICAGLALGVLTDVTDGRPCPSCGATMNREADCRVESLELKIVKGYHVRNRLEPRSVVGPAWLCSICEHCEEER